VKPVTGRRLVRAAATSLLLAFALAACGPAVPSPPASPAPADRSAALKLPVPPESDGPPRFPDLTPFRVSAWWAMLASKPLTRADLAKMRQKMSQAAGAGAAAKAASGGGDAAAVALPGAVPLSRRTWWSFVPVVIAQTESAWTKDTISSEELERLRTAAEHLAADDDGLRLDFGDGDPAQRRTELAKLARWLDAAVRRPASYAAMLFTMDDGPFVGLAASSHDGLAVTVLLDLGDSTRLSVGRAATTGWIMECVKGDRVLWERRFVAKDGGEFERVEAATKDAVESLGPYGWRVHLVADGEHAPVYLSASRELLFYFVSW
jgi:hypothetical protein